MAELAFFSHESCGLHDTGWGHPEHQGRLRAVMSAIGKALPDLVGVRPVAGRPLGDELLERVHSAEHVRRVRSACEEARASGSLRWLETDTVVSGRSWEAALAAAGCAVDAVRAVGAGEFRAAFCGVRPPGHHATRDRAMGFCLLNNVALAARVALEEGFAGRVLIVDWDVHHGNGTQEIFYRDDSVFYLSLHQHPLYPGTGSAEERGEGAGFGTTLNVPLPPGLPADAYVDALLGALDEAARFRPDLVLISAGFDAAAGDPLGGFTLEADHFALLTREVVRATADAAAGRVVSVLEGGYDPGELGRDVVAHLGALAEAVRATPPPRGATGGGGAPAGHSDEVADAER